MQKMGQFFVPEAGIPGKTAKNMSQEQRIMLFFVSEAYSEEKGNFVENFLVNDEIYLILRRLWPASIGFWEHKHYVRLSKTKKYSKSNDHCTSKGGRKH